MKTFCHVFTLFVQYFTAGVEEAGNTVVNKQFFDTLTIAPRVNRDVIVGQARNKEINLRYFSSGMVGKLLFLHCYNVINFVPFTPDLFLVK